MGLCERTLMECISVRLCWGFLGKGGSGGYLSAMQKGFSVKEKWISHSTKFKTMLIDALPEEGADACNLSIMKSCSPKNTLVPSVPSEASSEKSCIGAKPGNKLEAQTLRHLTYEAWLSVSLVRSQAKQREREESTKAMIICLAIQPIADVSATPCMPLRSHPEQSKYIPGYLKILDTILTL